MNIGVLREPDPLDRRVAVTPPVVRHLTERGHTVWVETGAGEGAMFPDPEYLRAGANVVFSRAEVIRRSALSVKISLPGARDLELVPEGAAMMAFYHLAVADQAVFRTLLDRKITAIGNEIVETSDGTLPLLRPVSEIAGQMTVHLAAHLLRSSSGGRGILLGGSPGVPPAHVVVLGAGVVGTSAARSAMRAGARVTALDTDSEKLRHLIEHVPNVATALAEADAIHEAITAADVAIGAVLVAGARTPHVVSKETVEAMKPGAVIIDVAIDQGGCFATSRPTTILEPTFNYHGVVHYSVPNLTADMGRSTSTALAQALLPYLLSMAESGVEGALARSPDLARGVYTFGGKCVHERLAATWGEPAAKLAELLGQTA
jgi:alanine dehydrogenase